MLTELCLGAEVGEIFGLLGLEAGRLALEVRSRGEMRERMKGDGTPGTESDLAAERYILAGLEARWPGFPVVSEESWDGADSPSEGRFLLVDPLDGTRSFIRSGEDFSVNIGVIEGDRAIFGMVCDPVAGVVWWGGADYGSWRVEWRDGVFGEARSYGSHRLASPLRVVCGHWGGKSLPRLLAGVEGSYEVLPPVGAALKFCCLAEGIADLYPRSGGSMEWDTAAGQAVLEGAGGVLGLLDGGGVLRYGKSGLRNPSFLAWS
ncbi:MAG: 3'(2'),5'-bisphosphate nucleotidase CysQ, partial [Alphaproteobacteria bacterium]